VELVGEIGVDIGVHRRGQRYRRSDNRDQWQKLLLRAQPAHRPICPRPTPSAPSSIPATSSTVVIWVLNGLMMGVVAVVMASV
jgi:hypothetical protein